MEYQIRGNSKKKAKRQRDGEKHDEKGRPQENEGSSFKGKR